MINPEIIDKFSELNIEVENLHHISRRADPADKLAGAHIVNQGDVNIYRSGDIVVKIAPEQKYEQYLLESKIYDYLEKNEFEMPEAISPPLQIGKSAILFTRFIEHDPFATPDPKIAGEIISKMHKIPAPDWLPVDNKIEEYLKQLPSSNNLSENDKETIISRCYKVTEAVSKQNQDTKMFCHGDLHLGNILPVENGKIRIIDFESASAGEPLWDISRLTQASEKYGLDKNWYQDFYKSWINHLEYNDEDIKIFSEWRSWYGVLNLALRPNLNQIEKTELENRLAWVHDSGNSSNWVRC